MYSLALSVATQVLEPIMQGKPLGIGVPKVGSNGFLLNKLEQVRVTGDTFMDKDADPEANDGMSVSI